MHRICSKYVRWGHQLVQPAPIDCSAFDDRVRVHSLIHNRQSIVKIMCDNQSAIDLGESGAFRPRIKHIDIRFHHIREKIDKQIIELEYIQTEKMLADSLTKAVSAQKTEFCRRGMGIALRNA